MMIWLFDLDNTRHNALLAIFLKISADVTVHIASPLDEPACLLSDDAASQLRMEYSTRFDATLPWISQICNWKAKDFVYAVRRFDSLASLVNSEKELPVLLQSLPGRKVLLTNSVSCYSEEIVKLPGWYRFFDAHIVMESMRVFGRFEPKPSGKFSRNCRPC